MSMNIDNELLKAVRKYNEVEGSFSKKTAKGMFYIVFILIRVLMEFNEKLKELEKNDTD